MKPSIKSITEKKNRVHSQPAFRLATQKKKKNIFYKIWIHRFKYLEKNHMPKNARNKLKTHKTICTHFINSLSIFLTPKKKKQQQTNGTKKKKKQTSKLIFFQNIIFNLNAIQRLPFGSYLYTYMFSVFKKLFIFILCVTREFNETRSNEFGIRFHSLIENLYLQSYARCYIYTYIQYQKKKKTLCLCTVQSWFCLPM